MSALNSRILIVDDEAPIRALLGEHLQLVGYDVAQAANGVAALKLLAGGEFDLAGLLPGSYLLVASNRGATGIVPLQVGDADVDGVMITVSDGFPLKGRIVVEGQLPNDKMLPFRLELQRDPDLIGMPSGGPSYNPPAAANGSFTAEGIHVGDFRATVGFLPRTAYVKSMRLGTIDVLDDGLHVSGPFTNPLEIVIGADGGRLAGSVTNSRNEPVVNATIVLVPKRRVAAGPICTRPRRPIPAGVSRCRD